MRELAKTFLFFRIYVWSFYCYPINQIPNKQRVFISSLRKGGPYLFSSDILHMSFINWGSSSIENIKQYVPVWNENKNSILGTQSLILVFENSIRAGVYLVP